MNTPEVPQNPRLLLPSVVTKITFHRYRCIDRPAAITSVSHRPAHLIYFPFRRLYLDLKLISLLPGLASLLAPREVPYRNSEEAKHPSALLPTFPALVLKEKREGITYLFESSAIPANATYQAKNAASKPKNAPPFCNFEFGAPP